MKEKYSLPLSSLIAEMGLEALYLPAEADTIMISNTEVNRPGLAFAGFFELFNKERIQIIGQAEYL